MVTAMLAISGGATDRPVHADGGSRLGWNVATISVPHCREIGQQRSYQMRSTRVQFHHERQKWNITDATLNSASGKAGSPL